MSQKFHKTFSFTFHWPDVSLMATLSWKGDWDMQSYNWVSLCPPKNWNFVTKEEQNGYQTSPTESVIESFSETRCKKHKSLRKILTNVTKLKSKIPDK